MQIGKLFGKLLCLTEINVLISIFTARCMHGCSCVCPAELKKDPAELLSQLLRLGVQELFITASAHLRESETMLGAHCT